jgi:hypothetical protein
VVDAVLQVQLLGTDPALGYWGSKAGSRELFARCGVPHPPGSGLTHNLDDLCEATAEVWESHPEQRQCVVKLNEGFSGEGCCRWNLSTSWPRWACTSTKLSCASACFT